MKITCLFFSLVAFFSVYAVSIQANILPSMPNAELALGKGLPAVETTGMELDVTDLSLSLRGAFGLLGVVALLSLGSKRHSKRQRT